MHTSYNISYTACEVSYRPRLHSLYLTTERQTDRQQALQHAHRAGAITGLHNYRLNVSVSNPD